MMRHNRNVCRPLLGALMLLAVASLAAGQAPAQTTGQTTEKRRTTVLPAYVLAADDTISINVINFPNLSGQIVVPPDGRITVALLEPIDVTGKTTNELARILADKWRKYVINPSVTVSLTQKRKENVLFYGFVTRPGIVEYRPTLHMMEALAEVGGATTAGDLLHVSLTRKSGDRITLDLSRPELKGGTEVDMPLQAGDVIYVPERRTEVNVLGEVGRPGSFEYKDDMTVLDALTQAGGVKETADLTKSTLIHNGKETKLDLEALLRRGDLASNFKLAAGDRIMVPEFQNRTYIFGAVAKPGYYSFKEGDRVLDALNSSGGPVRDANIAKINVIRIDRTKNEAKASTVDIEKALKEGKMEGNMLLQPGDVIFIPDKKHKLGLDDLFKVVGTVTGLDSIARIFTGGFGSR